MAFASPRVRPEQGAPRQRGFDELGTALFDTTFVVLDLETTGGSARADTITEVGAIKTVGGERTGTFHALVRPRDPITGYVELLTGITNSMVAMAPPIEEVLPSLWEFLNGTVVVAHNARFDAAFLSAAFKRHGYSVPFKKTVCTLKLARWLMKGETTNLKLESLSAMLGTATKPCHRAFDDASATLEVFFRLLELAGPHGVLTLEDLMAFSRSGRQPSMDKISLTAGIPRTLGVYKFVDRNGRVLYVGKAKNLRARVRSYFYGDERPGIAGLIRDVAKIDVERSPTEIWAEVRELQLIREHQPRYNRRGRRTKRTVWLKLVPGPIPRFVLGRTVGPKERQLLGPFTSVRSGKEALEALQEAAPIARCSQPKDHPEGCVFGQMGRCMAPCLAENRPRYQTMVAELATDLDAGASSTLGALDVAMKEQSESLRYEDAAVTRDRIEHLRKVLMRKAAMATLLRARELIICRPSSEGLEVTAFSDGSLVRSLTQARDAPVDHSALFGLFPSDEGHDDHEMLMLLWRHIGAAAKSGGWVEWCSGVFASGRSPLEVRELDQAS